MKAIHIYYGEDLFGIEKEQKTLIENAVSKDWKEFNLHILDGNDSNYRQITDAYRSPPFGDGARVVIANFIHKKGKTENSSASKNLTELFKFAAKEATDTKNIENPLNFLLIKALNLDKRLSSTKTLERDAYVKEFAPLKGRDLSNWVLENIKTKSKKIETDALKIFIDIVGSDRYRLSQEIDKLLTYIDRRDTITAADVKLLITDTTGDVFSILNNIAENKKDIALMELNRFLQKEHPLALLASLITNFKYIYYIKLMKSANTKDDEIIKILKIHPFIIKKAWMWKRFSLKQMQKALEELLNIELKLKSSASSPVLLLETWILGCL